jgi:hypothetical protein
MDFDDIIHSLSNVGDFEENPIEIGEFVTNKDYLNLPALSDLQVKMIKAMTQILKKETLIALYGEKEGTDRFRQTYNEIILLLGKGSGKDFCSTIACAYIVYILLCLKDPSDYYGKPSGDAIDIINIAINAQQAKNVFFKGFCSKIDNSPWFRGKYSKKADCIDFDKSISVYSGHSERESWEGLNLIAAVLDEISGFSMQNTSGNVNAKTADDIFKMFSASVSSRFPQIGKVVSLSFPRHKDDFLSTRYRTVVAQKDTIIKSHTFKLDESMPDGVVENELKIDWEEDHVISYSIPRVFALKRATWEVNPTIKIDNLINSFISDPMESLSRFACCPPDSDKNSYFPSKEKLELAFRYSRLMVDELGIISKSFKPDPEKIYYMHVDLSQKHDRTAISMAHVLSWTQTKMYDEKYLINPKIVVDFVRYWIPTKEQSIDLTEVKNFILQIYSMGFNIGLVTWDRWQSYEMMRECEAAGLKVDNLSLKKSHYDDFKLAIAEERVSGPNLPLLLEELSNLRIINNKVDHISCLVGETRIPLLNGTRPMISQIEGSEVWVYSSTLSGKIVPAKAKVFCSGETTLLLDVLLDNGEIVRCTPEHRFLLRSGKYKEAQYLSSSDELMSINFSIETINKSYKVREISFVELEESVKVYDLSVPKFNNFALAAGIFVHNSQHNDLSEAVCGAIYNAITHTPRYEDEEIEIVTLSDLKHIIRQKDKTSEREKHKSSGLAMPQDLSDFLKEIRII